MAVTVEMRTQVAELYVALFGRAPDAEGLGYWTQQLAGGATMAEVANAMYATDPARSFYPGWMTNQEIVASFYENALGRPADPEGLAYWTAKLDAPDASPGVVIQEIIDVVVNYTGSDPAGLESQALFNNKVAVAQWYGEHNGDIAGATPVLAGVTSDPASVEAAKTGTGETFTLTTGQDTVSGTSNGDLFKANVVQNDLGQQVNTLGSGDELDGKGGVDTLSAKATAGAFAGGSWSMPIQPETHSIETVEIQAVLANIDTFTGGFLDDPILNNDQVFLNAKDMLGVTDIGSFHSDADLTIQNLTTQDDAGNARPVSDMTVHMEYTGNADSHWNESDLKVYFDQDYLTSQVTRTNPMVDFLAMNEDNYDETDGAYPLDGVFFRELKFALNGERFDLKPYLGEDPEGTGSEITTYTEFLAAVQEALIQLKADYPDNAALQTIEASFGSNFTTDANPNTLELRVGTSVRLSVDGLTDGVENSLEVESTDLEVARAAGSLVPNNNRYELADANPPVVGEVLAINVALEKVGLAGDGGELVIGSMNKDGDNHWDAVATTVDSTKSGIEEFDVTVYGDSTQSSSLAGLHSTNNNLRVVNVVTDAALTGTSFADLTIGNSNTETYGEFGGYENALKDVQTFDASEFMGNLTLRAALTEEVAAKYLDLQDVQANPAADNVAFDYTTGVGDDDVGITVNAANFAQDGAATREDFDLVITTCAGDDHITLAIINGPGNLASNGDPYVPEDETDPIGFANWYDNQKLNANLRINAGEGNDTIWTPGSGDVVIEAGTGDDAVYADNTGDKAVWVFNTITDESVHTNLADLQSDTSESYRIYNGTLTVTFQGFEKTVELPHTQGVVSDLQVNQAIKDAINNDAVLSKLLVANDGPANTLVVESLIDGGHVEAADDLSVSIEATELSPGQAQQAAGLYGVDASAVPALIAASIADFDDRGDYDSTFATRFGNQLDGSDSFHTSDNTITGGLGDDVLVLGTGMYSNDTVVYEGFGNGTDTIVNFDTAWIPAYWNSTSYETLTLDFSDSDGDPAAETIVFDGVTVNLAAPTQQGIIPEADVATQFANQFDSANWAVGFVEPANGTVYLTHKTPGAVEDVVAGDLTGTYFTEGGGSVAASVPVQGLDYLVPGTPSTFTVTYDTATTAVTSDTAGDFTFDGVAVDLAEGDGALTVATKVADAAYTNWSVGPVVAGQDGSSYSVTFTEDDVSDAVAPIPTAADFKVDAASTSDGVIGSLTGTVGVADTTTPPVLIEGHAGVGFDYLDFSAYDAVAVHVDGALVDGFSDALAGQNYVELVQSTTDAGAYTATVYTEAGAADTVVGLIGVLDFGVEQNFVAENFIV